MSVEPGFGGQSNIELMKDKIREIKALVGSQGRRIEIEVDGGIAPVNILDAHLAGAGKFVVGSALWRSRSFGVAVKEIHDALN